MYIPAEFDASDPPACHALIEAHSFGLLVTPDAAGVPFASHLPFALERGEGALGTLYFHVAAGNPHARYVAPGAATLAVFQGPHGYVSPRWYAERAAVPTWNYVAVQARGLVRILEPNEALSALGRLVHQNEGDGPDAWQLVNAPEQYVRGLLRGIVAFAMTITDLKGKAKLSQNRPAEDARRVAEALDARGGSDAALAMRMREVVR